MTSPVRVLYVAGMGHSGSTLVARVLGEVEGHFPAGEVYALSERIGNGDDCGCGVPLGSCPFWTSVLQTSLPGEDALPRLRTDRRWIKGRMLPLLALGRDRRRLRTYREGLTKLYHAIAAVSGSRVVVDSSKSPTYAHILSRTPGIDLYVVHLVRDPRATSYSWSVDPHFHRTRGPAFGARWTLWNGELEMLAVRCRRRFVRMRFEEFLDAPIAETRRALKLIGAEDAELPFVGRNAVRLPRNHMIEGHPSRFDTGVVALRSNDAWHRRLSRRRELTTSLFASPLQLFYGYPLMRKAAWHD